MGIHAGRRRWTSLSTRRGSMASAKCTKPEVKGTPFGANSPVSIGRVYWSGFEPGLTDNVHLYSIHARPAGMHFRFISPPPHPPSRPGSSKVRTDNRFGLLRKTLYLHVTQFPAFRTKEANLCHAILDWHSASAVVLEATDRAFLLVLDVGAVLTHNYRPLARHGSCPAGRLFGLRMRLERNRCR